MDKENFAEKHCEKIDNVAVSCSSLLIKKVEVFMGRSLSTTERDEIVEELKSYAKVVAMMSLMDIVVNSEKEKQNESERPSNTLS